MTDPLIEEVKRTLLEALDPKRFLGPMKFFYCYRPIGCRPSMRAPAREFLDAQSKEVQASYAVPFQMQCNGLFVRGDKYHPWWKKDSRCEGISAYKDNSSQTRIVNITDRGQLQILLFGFGGKNEDDVEERHVLNAIHLRDEYRTRRSALEEVLRKARKR